MGPLGAWSLHDALFLFYPFIHSVLPSPGFSRAMEMTRGFYWLFVLPSTLC